MSLPSDITPLIPAADMASVFEALNRLTIASTPTEEPTRPNTPNGDQSVTEGPAPAPGAGAPTEPGMTLTLLTLIAALQLAGINVISPMDEIIKEELLQEAQAAQAAQAAATAQLSAQRVRIFGTTQRGVSPWSHAALPAPTVSAAAAPIVSAVTAGAVTAAVSVAAAPAVSAATAAAVSVAAAPAISAAAAPAISAAATPAVSAAAAASTSAAASDSGVTGFVCTSCHTYNSVRQSRDSYYCVIAGRTVGVYKGWHNVQPLVSGVGHACFQKHPSEADALTAFEEAQAAGYVVVLA